MHDAVVGGRNFGKGSHSVRFCFFDYFPHFALDVLVGLARCDIDGEVIEVKWSGVKRTQEEKKKRRNGRFLYTFPCNVYTTLFFHAFNSFRIVLAFFYVSTMPMETPVYKKRRCGSRERGSGCSSHRSSRHFSLRILYYHTNELSSNIHIQQIDEGGYCTCS